MNKNDFIFSLPQLKEYLISQKKNSEHVPKMLDDKSNFYLLIPRYYLNLIDWDNSNDPLMKMVVTSSLESENKQYEISDPIGDHEHSPVEGIVHRYPDRCLLMLTNICAVHCRFCFRKNLLTTHKADYTKSIDYIKNHKEIWEVILSGGDPFMLTDFFLNKVLTDLRKIPHVRIIRFHTRTPVVYPQRITKTFVSILKNFLPLTIVFHINHPKEITKEFTAVAKQLQKAGCLLLSQTVLMKDINNDPKILEKLFKGLVINTIKPYYLHHLDIAKGTDHFRVSVEEGKEIMQKLRGKISGTCLPEYVIDIPGGMGKVPVFWFHSRTAHVYESVSFEGKKISYEDPFYLK
jgi:lysine 2,3-aminomutase